MFDTEVLEVLMKIVLMKRIPTWISGGLISGSGS
jgi:hypothetical protein